MSWRPLCCDAINAHLFTMPVTTRVEVQYSDQRKGEDRDGERKGEPGINEVKGRGQRLGEGGREMK